MTPVLAISSLTIVIIVLAGLVGAAGLGLVAVNVLSIIRPRKAGQKGPPRKLVGPPPQMTRRGFFRKMLAAGFGFAMLDFGVASLAFLWPNLSGGFGGEITLGASATEIKQKITDTKLPYYYAPGRVYFVAYDDTNPQADIYKKAGLTAGGLMALYQRCVHLGCRVPFCESSQWFECPCHGSKYNRAGEYKAGPAPRGLDRFPLTIDKDIVKVNTGIIITGPPRGTNTTGQEKEGQFCV